MTWRNVPASPLPPLLSESNDLVENEGRNILLNRFISSHSNSIHLSAKDEQMIIIELSENKLAHLNANVLLST